MIRFGNGSGISWTTCKQSAPCSRQITSTKHNQSFFYRPYALPDARPTNQPLKALIYNNSVKNQPILEIFDNRILEKFYKKQRFIHIAVYIVTKHFSQLASLARPIGGLTVDIGIRRNLITAQLLNAAALTGRRPLMFERRALIGSANRTLTNRRSISKSLPAYSLAGLRSSFNL